MTLLKILGIIPARYGSTRFPGKPLVEIKGKPMIQWVYDNASGAKSLSDLVVATDDDRIFTAVKSFGGKVIMTRSDHRSGTDRCCEALEHYEQQNLHYDVVVNIQGDEPFIDPAQIDAVTSEFRLPGIQISTLARKIKNQADLFNTNINKVVFAKDRQAIYFSRHPIPFIQQVPRDDWLKLHDFYKHVGIYAYRRDILKEITNLPPSRLEQAEALEQLRWIENGYKIQVGLTLLESIAVDTPADLLKIINRS